MGEVTTVPLLGVIIALWLFIKFSPEHQNMRGVHTFNWMVVGLGALIWVIGYFTFQDVLERSGGGVIKYRYLLGLGGGGCIMIVYLGICYLLRNYWLFADKRRI